MIKKSFLILSLLISGFILMFPVQGAAQLTAPGASFTELTNYPVHPEKDRIYVFCSSENVYLASLTANTLFSGSKKWEWDKYNPLTGAFEFYFSEISTGAQSKIDKLEDGCYRVKISAGDSIRNYKAWVFNDWNSGTAEITESNCDYFALSGKINQAILIYYDLTNKQPVTLAKNVEIEWRKGEEIISKFIAPKIYDPPTKDTEYTLFVSDRFNCESSGKVMYQSIVTKAIFTVDPPKGEAPLEAKFFNKSENGDPGRYEWFFFRDIDEIKEESAKTTLPVDSFMVIAYDDNPVFTYEYSGNYMVKLVSKKKSQYYTCTDTVYLEDYIEVDTSYFAVPNVFTPNGDGTNDNLVIKFWSMQEVKITILNRWGRVVHTWESGNVRGFKNTWMETAWDGRIGGRMASPGVYFYVVEGFGRDGAKRWKHGSVYLFRDKD
jgi:gliding motility-associated-like protein